MRQFSWGWTKVRSYNGVRADLGDPPSPPMQLHAGAVRVSGTVTYDTAREKYFVLFLTPRHPTGPGRVYSFRLVFSATDDARTEGFAGSVKRLDAGGVLADDDVRVGDL